MNKDMMSAWFSHYVPVSGLEILLLVCFRVFFQNSQQGLGAFSLRNWENFDLNETKKYISNLYLH